MPSAERALSSQNMNFRSREEDLPFLERPSILEKIQPVTTAVANTAKEIYTHPGETAKNLFKNVGPGTAVGFATRLAGFSIGSPVVVTGLAASAAATGVNTGVRTYRETDHLIQYYRDHKAISDAHPKKDQDEPQSNNSKALDFVWNISYGQEYNDAAREKTYGVVARIERIDAAVSFINRASSPEKLHKKFSDTELDQIQADLVWSRALHGNTMSKDQLRTQRRAFRLVKRARRQIGSPESVHHITHKTASKVRAQEVALQVAVDVGKTPMRFLVGSLVGQFVRDIAHLDGSHSPSRAFSAPRAVIQQPETIIQSNPHRSPAIGIPDQPHTTGEAAVSMKQSEVIAQTIASHIETNPVSSEAPRLGSIDFANPAPVAISSNSPDLPINANFGKVEHLSSWPGKFPDAPLNGLATMKSAYTGAIIGTGHTAYHDGQALPWEAIREKIEGRNSGDITATNLSGWAQVQRHLAELREHDNTITLNQNGHTEVLKLIEAEYIAKPEEEFYPDNFFKAGDQDTFMVTFCGKSSIRAINFLSNEFSGATDKDVTDAMEVISSPTASGQDVTKHALLLYEKLEKINPSKAKEFLWMYMQREKDPSTGELVRYPASSPQAELAKQTYKFSPLSEGRYVLKFQRVK